MPVIRSRKVFMKAAKFLGLYFPSLPSSVFIKAVETLSLIADSEDFGTYRDRHVDLSTSEDLDVLLHLKENCLSTLPGLEYKSLLRPLIDAIEKAKRSYAISSRK